jgi:phage-related holin
MLLLLIIFIRPNKTVIIKIFQIKERTGIQVGQLILEKYSQEVLISIILMMVNKQMIKKLIFKNNHCNRAYMQIYRKNLKLIIIMVIILIRETLSD